jgi:hypothetical protein
VPEISYANPLANHPAAIGYHSLDRTCAELDDGASWRRLLGRSSPTWTAHWISSSATSGPYRPTRVVGASRSEAAAAGHRAWNLLRGEDARALFTGVAAHRFRQCRPSWPPARD